MGYQSKTYSLADEVVEAIDAAKAAGETPSRYLLRLIKGSPVPTVSAGGAFETEGKKVERVTRGVRPKGDKTR